MLKIISISSADERHQILKEFDPRVQTWLVADLTSKSEIQKILLQKYEVLEEDSVLRATELWTKIFKQTFPTYRIVSNSLIQTLLKKWLLQQNLSWAQSGKAAESLFTYIQQLLPILVRQDHEEVVIPWFQENTASFVKWGAWYETATRAWGHLQDLKLIPSRWISSFLSGQVDDLKSWNRSMVVDLGSELTGVEAELIQAFSKSNQVEVLDPNPMWKDRYFSALWPYYILKQESFFESYERLQRGANSFKEEVIADIEWLKYSTMTSEVKDIVSRVRDLLNSGVEQSKIAIVAPDIETYWPVLSSYLEVEGVQVKKTIVARAQSYLPISRWLSSLRVSIQKVSSSDIELQLFYPTAEVKYDLFRQLYSNLYEKNDLQRNEEIFQRLSIEKNIKELFSRDEFVKWSVGFWNSENGLETLLLVLQPLIQECPPDLEMNIGDWVGYLEQIVSEKEIRINESLENGIYCENISAASWLPVDYLFVFGATEKALNTVSKTSLSLNDVLSLSKDLGFTINLPEQNNLEFEARWISSRLKLGGVVSVPVTDFMGNVEAPSLLWLSQSLIKGDDPHLVRVPNHSRWDSIQLNPLKFCSNERQWGDELAKSIDDRVEVDIGNKELSFFEKVPELSLSVTQLEKYARCPFVFAAEKLFHLSHLPEVDLDVDRMTRGRLMHAIFEQLTIEPIRYDWSDNELRVLIDQIKDKLEFVFADDKLWSPLRERYLILAKNFLKFEKEWRGHFPKTRTVGREVSLRAKWSSKEGKLVSKEHEGFVFRGSIDRVDSDGTGNYLVSDYKSSSGSVKNFTSWLEEDSFQMALYVQAVMDGLTFLKPGEVQAALYMVAKTLEKKKGFKLKELSGNLYEIGSRERSSLDKEALQRLFQQVNERVNSLVKEMENGEFIPRPKEKTKNCPDCDWRSICRASHLN